MAAILKRKLTGADLERLEFERERRKKERITKAAARKERETERREALLFEKALRIEYFRLGEYYAFHHKYEDGGGKRLKRRKIQYVKFKRRVATPEAFYFQIATGHSQGLSYKRELPHMVRVADLVDEDTLRELSAAIKHPVSMRWDEGGVWLIVHRTGNVRPIPNLVTHREMLQHYPPDAAHGAHLVLGVGEHREVHDVSLESYPHVLIAGASGGGKSNMLNHILCTLVRYHSRDELKLLLIDPKRLELIYYRNVPHLMGHIITDVNEAIDALDDMISEVQRRTTIMEGEARKLSDWNRAHPAKRMARIVIVVEEMAALMRTRGERLQVQANIETLANLGRAVGVHLVLCTQLPIVEIVPSTIKVSMWVRIAGRVQNHTESGVIIGSSEAARLPAIPGRMIYGKDADKYEIQTPLTLDEDVQLALKIARGRAEDVVRLDGWRPAINPSGLIVHLAHDREFRGQLTLEILSRYLERFAISSRQARAFIEDVIKYRQFRIDDEAYEVVPRGQVTILHPINDAARAQAARRDALLMLPAPGQTVAMPEPPQQPPEVYIPPKPKQPSEGFELFIKERCVFDPVAVSVAADLYDAYLEFIQGEWPKLPKRTFGVSLKALNLESVRVGKRGQNGWRGITLGATTPEETTTSDTAVATDDAVSTVDPLEDTEAA
jgi:hypothetical protein